MATALQNYQVLEDSLARNFSNPINNYIAQNTALGIQRQQLADAQTRRLAELQAERNFTAQQQDKNLQNQLVLQKSAQTAQSNLLDKQFANQTQQRTHEELLRQAAIARQDPLMADYNPTASVEDTVVEYNKRRGPEYANPYYADRATEAKTRIASALTRLSGASSNADPAIKQRALQQTLLDPSVSADLIKYGVNANDLNKAITSGNPALYQQIVDSVRKKATGIFGGQEKADAFILNTNAAYYKNLAAQTDPSKLNPQFVSDIGELQASNKLYSDYLGKITDKKILTDVLKPIDLSSKSSIAIPPPQDNSFDPSLGLQPISPNLGNQAPIDPTLGGYTPPPQVDQVTNGPLGQPRYMPLF